MAETKKVSNTKTKETEAASKELSIIDQVMEQTRLKFDDNGYEIAKRGMEAFLKQLVSTHQKQDKVDKNQVDRMIDELDNKLSVQIDEILHHPDFQALEATWKGLKLLVDRTDFRENIKVQIVNSSKEDLLDDFKDATEVSKSALYHHVYTEEYGQFGGEPVGVILADYQFTPKANDIELLRHLSSVCAMSHCPLIAGADASFFSIDEYDELPKLRDLESVFDGPQYAKWHGLRESDDARNIGLVMPRFLARAPYGEENPVRSFNYQEVTNGDKKNYLWANACYSFGTRITESFAKFRWCPNIIGPQSGGELPDLPLDLYETQGQTRIIGPTEVTLSDRREFELSEQGFIPFTMRKGADNATFFSANSIQKPKFFGTDPDDRQAELNYRLGTQLPYMFIVDRLAHYIKVLQRENLGSWKSRNDLERELNRWIRQYVSDQENPLTNVRSKRPLRSAEILVSDVPGEAGWYSVEISVTPHFKFMGASFTLSLTGRLDLM